MPEKIQHVLDQLPQHRTVLRERMVVDRDFRSLCEDYGDAFEALRHWEVSADGRRAARVEEFGHLLGRAPREVSIGRFQAPARHAGVNDRRRDGRVAGRSGK